SSAATREVFRRLGLASASVAHAQGNERLWTISNRSLEVCGPMSGLRMRVSARRPQEVITLAPAVNALISTAEGLLFGAVDINGKQWYIASGNDFIDISQPLEKGYFDVADYFCSAVPIVMFLRHAFRGLGFGPAELGACLILDDPVL